VTIAGTECSGRVFQSPCTPLRSVTASGWCCNSSGKSGSAVAHEAQPYSVPMSSRRSSRAPETFRAALSICQYRPWPTPSRAPLDHGTISSRRAWRMYRGQTFSGAEAIPAARRPPSTFLGSDKRLCTELRTRSHARSRWKRFAQCASLSPSVIDSTEPLMPSGNQNSASSKPSSTSSTVRT